MFAFLYTIIRYLWILFTMFLVSFPIFAFFLLLLLCFILPLCAECRTVLNAALMMDTEKNDCYLSLLWLQNAHYCDLMQSKPGHLGENCFSVTFD